MLLHASQYTYSALAIHIITVVMLKHIQWHAVPGKWTENNTGAPEQVFQLFWQSKKKTEMKLSFVHVRLNLSSICFCLTVPPILAL